MGGRMKQIVVAGLAGAVISYIGVQYFFNPSMPDPAFTPVVDNDILSSVLYWVVGIVFFDWAVQKTGQTMNTAILIAAAQILLVDFNYVMIGRRELIPAIYSAILITVIWTSVAFVYDKVSDSA